MELAAAARYAPEGDDSARRTGRGAGPPAQEETVRPHVALAAVALIGLAAATAIATWTAAGGKAEAV